MTSLVKPAWRGVVVGGVVWAWPTMLMDHNQAFAMLPYLRGYSCRWRQWTSGDEVDFDPGTSTEDRALVQNWITEVQK